MTETKMISEREAVLRERAAFYNGVLSQEPFFSDTARERVRVLAATRYPLPKMPRIERDDYGREWRLVGPRLEAQFRERGETIWTRTPTTSFLLDERILGALAKLVAQPTEEVEDSSDV